MATGHWNRGWESQAAPRRSRGRRWVGRVSGWPAASITTTLGTGPRFQQDRARWAFSALMCWALLKLLGSIVELTPRQGTRTPARARTPGINAHRGRCRPSMGVRAGGDNDTEATLVQAQTHPHCKILISLRLADQEVPREKSGRGRGLGGGAHKAG